MLLHKVFYLLYYYKIFKQLLIKYKDNKTSKMLNEKDNDQKNNEIIPVDFMDEAIKEAKKALLKDEVPVGCVIVYDDKIIARGHNQKESKNCAVYHAEVNAIIEASKVLNNFRLNSCTMYVTLEPCPMCASLINQSRIKNVVVGCYEHNSGSFGSVIDFSNNRSLGYDINVKFDIRKEIIDMMQDFFIKKRWKGTNVKWI